jgi:hypothetical protein
MIPATLMDPKDKPIIAKAMHVELHLLLDGTCADSKNAFGDTAPHAHVFVLACFRFQTNTV